MSESRSVSRVGSESFVPAAPGLAAVDADPGYAHPGLFHSE